MLNTVQSIITVFLILGIVVNVIFRVYTANKEPNEDLLYLVNGITLFCIIDVLVLNFALDVWK